MRLCLVEQIISTMSAVLRGFILNAVYAILFCRSLLGGGFDLSNDVFSSTIPGSDGLGRCLNKPLKSV